MTWNMFQPVPVYPKGVRTMYELTRLEHLAIDAHRRGETWREFWEVHRHVVGRIEPYDRVAYRRLVRRLSHLLTCGDADGMTVASDWSTTPSPWPCRSSATARPRPGCCAAPREPPELLPRHAQPQAWRKPGEARRK